VCHSPLQCPSDFIAFSIEPVGGKKSLVRGSQNAGRVTLPALRFGQLRLA
jgi:hypothetical protein